MIGNKIVFLTLLNSLFILIACNSDGNSIDDFNPDLNLFDCEVDNGDFNFLDASLNVCPYQNFTSIIFENEHQTQLSFEVINIDAENIDGVFYDYNVYEEGDTINYCYTTQRKQYLLRNESLNFSLELNIEAKPYYAEFESRYSADVLNILYNDFSTTPEIYSSVFRKTIDQRDYPAALNANNSYYDIMNFLGTDFMEIEKTNINNPSLNLFYNVTEGIVAFENERLGLWKYVSAQ